MGFMGVIRNGGMLPSDFASKRWPRTLALLVILGTSIAINEGVRSGAEHLQKTSISRLMSGAAHAENLATPRAGEQALTEPILLMVGMLRENGIESFGMSQVVFRAPFVRQRLAEGAWPIRYDGSAEVEVAFLVEAKDCEIIDQRKFEAEWRLPKWQAELFQGKLGVKLVRCP
jgi:hypothetical protein